MRVPSQYTTKVEKIKNIILSRSGLLTEYGLNNLKMEVEEFYESGDNEVSEIVFILKLNDVECSECDFEPEQIGKTILELRDRLTRAASFYISPTFDLKSTKSSLRGILFYDCKIWRAEFQELTFGIFYDVGVEY